MDKSTAYGEVLAEHYRAYRPPLHKLILERVLPLNCSFETGVDIGCGTGYSTMALAEFCRRVYGIEPSKAMLRNSSHNPAISYKHGYAENIPLPDACADIATYAGVLFYTDIRRAAAELQRICKRQAQVVVYDFVVLLDDFAMKHGLKVESELNNYNHELNFAGMPGFSNKKATIELIDFDVNAKQLAHLLLSEPHLYSAYVKHYGEQKPYQSLKQDLLKYSRSFTVEANIFFTLYRVNGNSL